MTDTIGPPIHHWPTTVALIFAAVGGLFTLIAIALLSGMFGQSGVDVLPMQSRPDPATASQVEVCRGGHPATGHRVPGRRLQQRPGNMLSA